MVGPATDCLSNPLGCVRLLFDQALASGAQQQQLANSDWGAKEFFTCDIGKLGGIEKVPQLNSTPLDLLPSGSLVRFQGMVQDMFDPEYYIGAFKASASSPWHTTKYTDVTEVPIATGPDAQVWERKLLYCVPVPGQSCWSHGCAAAAYPAASPRREKRPREEDMDEAEGIMDAEVDASSSPAELPKRQRDGSPSAGPSQSAQSPGLLGEGLNLPLPSSLLPCLVKVYDDDSADLKLNDVAEFVGILTFDPQLSIHGSGPGGELTSALQVDAPHDDSMEEELPPGMRLSQAKVPRLQCIFSRKLTQLVPSLPPPTAEGTEAAAQELAAAAPALRPRVLSLLAGVLGGDALAAQYLLLHLLSKVTGRSEPLAVGKLALNLTGCVPAASPSSACPMAAVLHSALPALVPTCSLLPLSLPVLNAAPLVPRKDYSLNRLLSGPLQLAAGTVLIVDETALQAGQANSTGVTNLQALQHLIEWQKLEYDFQFYKVDMLTDLPVLLLSEARSLLPADVVLPLRQTRDAAWEQPPEEELTTLRRYLAMAKGLEHAIPPATTKAIEDDLVAARKSDPSLTSDDFHRWLTLARLTAVSYGESTLSMARWSSCRDMERLRLDRLRCV